MAIDTPITVGMIGLGAQAVTQLHAISRVRTLRLMLELADEHDVGRRLQLESIPVDPYDPYGVVR